MNNKLYIDFETRSTLVLKEVGLDNYARHSTTDIWCMAWAFNDEDPYIFAHRDESLLRVFEHIEIGDLVYAHNAAFELAIWNNIMVPRYGWPALLPSQTRCTMAMAYAMALPGGLEKAAAAVGLEKQKDMSGHRLMLQMSMPRDTKDGFIKWWDEPKKLEQLYEYCKQDVRVERELERRLFPLSNAEQKLWEVDYEINNRGIYVDTKAITAAISAVQTEADRLNKEIRNTTANFVGFTSEVARIKTWLQSQGVVMDSLAKADVIDTLDLETLPEHCRKVLLIRQEAGKTSTAKLSTMLMARSKDDRVRNTMQYHGAGTGRWAGRRIQPHNLPRPKLSHKEIENILSFMPVFSTTKAIDRIEILYGSVTHVISDCIRGFITAAPGNLLIAGDYSNIEGRGIAWLAGEEWKLDAFRAQDAHKGPEIYQLAASKIYHVDPLFIDKKNPKRQIGKVAELACGYQGGVGAFQRMAKTYNLKISDEEASLIKDEWRAAHPRIVQYWWDLERSAYDAVCHPGTTYSAGPKSRAVFFKTKGSFLFCLLPSGRMLCYPYPTLKSIDTSWGEVKEQVHYMTVDGLTNKWVQTHTYGGKLAENITQAICRDLLANAIMELENEKMNVVLHVHDEIVCELSEGQASIGATEVCRDKILNIMAAPPKWAAGLPIVVEGWIGKRYRK